MVGSGKGLPTLPIPSGMQSSVRRVLEIVFSGLGRLDEGHFSARFLYLLRVVQALHTKERCKSRLPFS